MKCLILGGGGFIGSAICDRLLLKGYQVRILARRGHAPYRAFKAQEKIEWMWGDFLNVHDIREATKNIDIIFHLISTTTPKNAHDDPLWDVQSNPIRTLKLLEVLREQPIKKIIYLSSGGAIYGTPQYLPIDEKHPTDPMTSYGITKLAIEKHLQRFAELYHIPCLMLRVSNPYGQRQRIESAQGAVSVFLRYIIQDVPITIWGDGEIIRDYIYIDDVAAACQLAISYNQKKQIFNVGSGDGVSLNQLINIIEQITGRAARRIYEPRRTFDVQENVLSNKLIKNEFLWEPSVTLYDGIKKFFLEISDKNS